MKKGIMTIILASTWAIANSALGQSRAELADLYLGHVRKHQPIYQATPVSHIVPDFNTITYALAGSKTDINITSPDMSSAGGSLRLGGYDAATYLALSLRRIGLGFSVGMGQKTADYKLISSGGYSAQRSKLDYSGIGIFLFNAPLGKQWKRIKPGLVFGGRMLNAKHGTSVTKRGSTPQDIQISDKELQSQDYAIFAYEAGFNINIKIFRNFGMIPWADYNYNDTRKAQLLADKNSSRQQEMRSDVQLFWRDKPPFNYGLDFSVRFLQLEVRLGGLLGLIAAYGSDVDYIEDNSLSLSFSLDQKGR